MTWDQVAAVAVEAGWRGGDAAVAVAITEPESGRKPRIVQAGQPYATTGWGLWQITPGNSVPRYGIDGALLDPLNNARAGHAKWAAAGGFRPWTTWVNGLETPYLGEAAAAVSRIERLTPRQARQLISQARQLAARGGSSVVTASDWSPQIRASARHAGQVAAGSMAAARHIHGLVPGQVRPAVTVPAAGSLLWAPGQHPPELPEET